MNRAGKVCIQLKQCEEDMEIVSFENGDPVNGRMEEHPSVEREVYRALVLGVRDYVNKNGFPGVIIGLSGGVDSALVLAIAVDALGPEKVRAVMMPSPYTSDISRIDAAEMVPDSTSAMTKFRFRTVFPRFCRRWPHSLRILPKTRRKKTFRPAYAVRF